MLDKPNTPETLFDNQTDPFPQNKIASENDLSRTGNAGLIDTMRINSTVDLQKFGLVANISIIDEKDQAKDSSSNEPNNLEKDKEIQLLIKQLGDDSFLDREKATSELRKLGVKAVPALCEALKDSDPEIGNRALNILKPMLKNEIDHVTGKGLLANVSDFASRFGAMPGGAVKGPVNDEVVKQLFDRNTYTSDLDLKDIPVLNSLSKMKDFDLSSNNIQDLNAGLLAADLLNNPKEIGKRIEKINCCASKITDKGLEHLVDSAPNLKTLILSGTKITDASLEKLAKMQHLEKLAVDCETVTEKGLSKLVSDSKSLKHLVLVGRDPDGQFAQSLKQLKPNLVITNHWVSADAGNVGADLLWGKR